MKRRVWLLLAALISAALPIVAQSPQQPTDADFDWVWQFQNRALESLMPLELKSRQIVAYRSDHDLQRIGDIERHFVISYAPGLAFNWKAFTASVVAPLGRSIQHQLLDLHMADRSAPFDLILTKVALRRFAVDSASCSAVRRRLDALSDVVIKLAFPRDRFLLFFHPISHRLVVRTESLTISAAENDPESPLVRWAIQTNDDFAECGRRQDAPVRGQK